MKRILVLLVCSFAIVINSTSLNRREVRRKLRETEALPSIVKSLEEKGLLLEGHVENGKYMIRAIEQAIIEYDELVHREQKNKRKAEDDPPFGNGKDGNAKDYIQEELNRKDFPPEEKSEEKKKEDQDDED